VTVGAVAIVTGAAGDIGRAVSERLAADGWRLLLTDHPSTEAALQDAARTCGGAPGDVLSSCHDLLAPEGAEAVIDECLERVGTPAGLVNCAGTQGDFHPTHRYPIHELQRVLSINVVSVMDLTSTCARAMIADHVAGSVVNLASMAGVSGAPNMPAYSASKAAVIGLTKAAAKDLAPFGIRVNAVSPAFIGPGRMWDRQVLHQAQAGSQYYEQDPGKVAEQMTATVPMRRVGSPSEVADAIGFLLGDRSTYVTGVNLEVSGGAT
jgi:NAD(P)-dependent dehydrogenase (short-subunit alcohol dehydrogenase family)